MDVLNSDAHALSDALAQGNLTATALMDATLARIGDVNPDMNAIVSLRDRDTLMAEAAQADQSPRKGWLHGMPMAIKDLSNAEGLATSRGSPLFKDDIAPQDDLFVRRLRSAGALIIGKTNTPEFGLGSHTFNPVHGATRNPYDLGRSVGGSSGGAAAALAARMVAVADGSDMMGSLRNPAGWNNVYGMRPTWGRVPDDPTGDVFLHQLATAGPMARSPRDLAMLLDTMAGHEPRQPLSLGDGPVTDQLTQNGARYKIGWLGDWGGALPFDAGLLEISEAALGQMAGMGHTVEPLAAPFPSDALWDSWITLRSFAVASGLQALYDDPLKRAHLKPAALWEAERGMAMGAMDVHRASLIRSDWLRCVMDLFDRFDILVLPSAQVWPFDVSAVHPTRINGVDMDTYHRWMQVVIPAGLVGLPVVNVPVGFGDNGLPAGIQLIGKHRSDGALLAFANEWHKATNWPGQRPPPM